MATSEGEVTRLYLKILIPLGIIYTEFVNSERYENTPGDRRPKDDPIPKRVFSDIPLKFGQIPGRQLGIFLGDLPSEKRLYESYETTRTAVIINVKEINGFDASIGTDGVCLLLAHELGHAFRWYLGHAGGPSGYTSEPWARTLEMAYVEALQSSIHASHLGVDFEVTKKFITKYRKSLYKSTPSEKEFYTALTGDSSWPVEVPSKIAEDYCADCGKPLRIKALHTLCKS